MPSYLLDTNVLVDTLRKVPAAIEYFDSLGKWPYSVVCRLELIAGARNQKEVEALNKYLQDFIEIALSLEIGTKGCEIMTRYANANGMDPLDALIAAAAINEDLTLSTKNDKHYRDIEGLKIEVPGY
jgi:predicted nucleic acid-binding protein